VTLLRGRTVANADSKLSCQAATVSGPWSGMCKAVSISPHVPDYDVGELALVGAAELALGLVRCSLRQVCAGWRVAAGLGDMDDVECGVHHPVASEIEPVAASRAVALAG
jgi:hypothetical protein